MFAFVFLILYNITLILSTCYSKGLLYLYNTNNHLKNKGKPLSTA